MFNSEHNLLFNYLAKYNKQAELIATSKRAWKLFSSIILYNKLKKPKVGIVLNPKTANKEKFITPLFASPRFTRRRIDDLISKA